MIREILDALLKGEVSLEEAERLLKLSALEALGEEAKLDLGREARKGIPEIILAEGKSPSQVVELVRKMLRHSGRVLVSRLGREHLNHLRKAFPKYEFKVGMGERILSVAKPSRVKRSSGKSGGKVGIITAGTSDIPVAEEARLVAEEMGCETLLAYDVGVAGVHRLLPALRRMVEASVDVLIVIAGMEGALPSVVAGLVDIPIIGVPTSMSYGFGEKGLAALMAMLQACPLGIAVVNIDNGVAAGAFAALIANRMAAARREGL